MQVISIEFNHRSNKWIVVKDYVGIGTYDNYTSAWIRAQHELEADMLEVPKERGSHVNFTV